MTSATEPANFCRCCLVNQSNLVDMNESFEIGKVRIKYSQSFFECAGINQKFAIPGIDDHPKICQPCSKQLKCAFVFRTLCRKVDQILRSKYSPEPVSTAALLLVSDPHAVESNCCYNDIYLNNQEDHVLATPAPKRTNRIVIDVKDLPLTMPKKVVRRETAPESDVDKFKRPEVLSSQVASPCGEAAKPGFSCKYCRRSFFRASGLWEHTFDHIGIRPFNCPECDFKTKRKPSFMKHLLDHHGIAYVESEHGYHGKNINYKDIRFINAANLPDDDDDQPTHAAGDKLLNGSIPDKDTMLKLAADLAMSANGRPPKWGRASSKHAPTTPSRLKKRNSAYQCTECPRSFKTSSGLRDHRFDHTGRYPFNCPVDGCQYFSKRKGIFFAHMRRHAEAEATATTEEVVHDDPMGVDGDAGVMIKEEPELDVEVEVD
jgi:Zinc finger, C2H2 type